MNEQAIVGENIAGQATALRKRLLLLSENLKEQTFDLAAALTEAKKYWSQWGYESLGDYSEQELNIKERKARYLVRIVEVCAAVGVKREHYELVGITKLREITTLDPKATFFNKETKENEPMSDHIFKLLWDAQEMTAEQIEKEVKRLKGQDGPNAQVMRSFGVTQSCWTEVISVALELARRNLGSKGRDSEGSAIEYSDGACYEALAANYINDPNNYPETAEAEQKEEGLLPIPTEEN